jgi:hypothetical protein
MAVLAIAVAGAGVFYARYWRSRARGWAGDPVRFVCLLALIDIAVLSCFMVVGGYRYSQIHGSFGGWLALLIAAMTAVSIGCYGAFRKASAPSPE